MKLISFTYKEFLICRPGIAVDRVTVNHLVIKTAGFGSASLSQGQTIPSCAFNVCFLVIAFHVSPHESFLGIISHFPGYICNSVI